MGTIKGYLAVAICVLLFTYRCQSYSELCCKSYWQGGVVGGEVGGRVERGNLAESKQPLC